MARTIVIGVGYHARRIYLPYLMGDQPYAKLVCGIDITSQREVIENYLKKRGYELPVYYTDDLEQDLISNELDQLLTDAVKTHKADSVIISTEPLMHFKYAKWALEHNLNILMDKPITTELGISVDIEKARKVKRDYDELASIYKKRKAEGKVKAFSLMSQRRFHPAYRFMKTKIEEVFSRTNCPISSIQLSHSDGMWRMPTEIIDLNYHPYNQGYGKMSHSGYHSLDMINYFSDITSVDDKEIDNIDVVSMFVRPNDCLSQFGMADYKSIFPDFHKYNKYTEEQFRKITRDYGEIDAFTTIAFKRGSDTLCLGSINAIHNGFSQRSWLDIQGRDLYKGNGRIRQESYFIEQGPFQSIAFISYQSEEVDPKKNRHLYDFGGEWHLDVHVFRNSKLFPDWKAHELFSIKQINNHYLPGYSRGHQEDARVSCIIDFYTSIKENRDTNSDLLSHKKGTYLLSALYESAIMSTEGKNPVINFKVGQKNTSASRQVTFAKV